jgi:HEPN domain-containing protein
MTTDMRTEGLMLMREGERILQRDVQAALKDGDFNVVVRRAQEVVELNLKGALRVLGVDYPRVHDVGPVFSEQVRRKRGAVDEKVLEQIEDVSLWLSQARAPAFYFEQDYGEQDAQRAAELCAGVLERAGRDVADQRDRPGAPLQGSTGGWIRPADLRGRRQRRWSHGIAMSRFTSKGGAGGAAECCVRG